MCVSVPLLIYFDHTRVRLPSCSVAQASSEGTERWSPFGWRALPPASASLNLWTLATLPMRPKLLTAEISTGGRFAWSCPTVGVGSCSPQCTVLSSRLPHLLVSSHPSSPLRVSVLRSPPPPLLCSSVFCCHCGSSAERTAAHPSIVCSSDAPYCSFRVAKR